MHNASDASSRLVELLDCDEKTGLTTEEPAQLGAPSAPKRYALPTDWEQHKGTIRQLYLDENKPLREVMAIMLQDYGHFGRYVSERMSSCLSHSLIVAPASNSIRTNLESGSLIQSTKDIRTLGREITSVPDVSLQ
jgi:hypothetical protein